MALRLYGDGNIENVTSINTDVSSTELGYLDGLTSALQGQIDTKLPLAGGKILQIVRATDTTLRTTTSTSLVDVTGMSVTITPQKSDSAVMIVATCRTDTRSAPGPSYGGTLSITDASNNAIAGAEACSIGVFNFSDTGTGIVNDIVTLVGYATPATTSATTYKLRFAANDAEISVRNNAQTGQMFAIEVSA